MHVPFPLRSCVIFFFSFDFHPPNTNSSKKMNVLEEDQTKTKGQMLWNLGNIQQNTMTIKWVRSAMAITCGIMTGILGVTGLQGFVGFLFFHVIVSLGLVIKSNFKLGDYVPGVKLHQFLVDGIMGELMSFLLFWTMFYGLTHVY